MPFERMELSVAVKRALITGISGQDGSFLAEPEGAPRPLRAGHRARLPELLRGLGPSDCEAFSAGTLAERGRQRDELFSWDRTARLFRAHYRRIGGQSLAEEDRNLLAAPPPA